MDLTNPIQNQFPIEIIRNTKASLNIEKIKEDENIISDSKTQFDINDFNQNNFGQNANVLYLFNKFTFFC